MACDLGRLRGFSSLSYCSPCFLLGYLPFHPIVSGKRTVVNPSWTDDWCSIFLRFFLGSALLASVSSIYLPISSARYTLFESWACASEEHPRPSLSWSDFWLGVRDYTYKTTITSSGIRDTRCWQRDYSPGSYYQWCQTHGLLVMETKSYGLIAALPISVAQVSSVVMTAEKGKKLAKKAIKFRTSSSKDRTLSSYSRGGPNSRRPSKHTTT